jgi:8-oxo-dGTP pyrophosphatase MutT (NUDIX family)
MQFGAAYKTRRLEFSPNDARRPSIDQLWPNGLMPLKKELPTSSPNDVICILPGGLSGPLGFGNLSVPRNDMRSATVPAGPHVICEGGFAWHDNERMRRCFVGDVSADVALVDMAINAIGDKTRPNANLTPAIDRLVAICDLRNATTGLVMRKLFRAKCPNCGSNHYEVVRQSVRAMEHFIHPGAVDALRNARVPVVHLRFPDIRTPGSTNRKGIPVIPGDDEGTRLAQIAFALRFTRSPPFAAVAYVRRGPLILAVSRKDTGELSAPGGKVEAGEHEKNTALRELHEEAGVLGHSPREIYRGVDDLGHDVAVFLVEIDGDAEPVAREPGTRVEWVAPEALATGFCRNFHRRALIVAGIL